MKAERLAEVWTRLGPCMERRLDRAAEALAGLDRQRLTLNPDGPLKRGFARVHRSDGHLARQAADLGAGEAVRLVFQDGERGAVVTDGEARTVRKTAERKPAAPSGLQGDLF
jgi:exodeoxyribonuclease VII large subunit